MEKSFTFPAIQRKKLARFSLVTLFAGAAVVKFAKHKRRTALPAPSFVMEKVEQNTKQIALAWPDAGGPYQVFRGHKLVYSGMEPGMIDQDLTPGTLYTYTIERLGMDSEVLERMKVQTSTAVEEKRAENILLDLITTTIITINQVILEWEPIEGIKEYTIFRNGIPIGKVNRCTFIDQSIEDHVEYTYSIKAKRPLQDSEQEVSEGKSLVAGLVGTLKKGSSRDQAAKEEFWISKKIPPINQLLHPSSETKQETSKQLRYTTFLPEKWIKNPNVVSADHYFQGDDREFDPESDTFRTRADVYLKIGEDENTVELQKHVGETKAYNWYREFIESDKASDELIRLDKVLTTEESTSFVLSHSVKNPVVLSPAIDYEVHVTFYHNGAVDIAGIHDQSPNHEVYLKEGNQDWEILHQAESKGLEMLAPPTANQLWRYTTLV
ncbi:DUF3238 domain-containing protein [Mesobacillus foraminis]|uniref:Uncharacterized protein DUF3238 n=1 Tax=Mesobacillus foraminis TaxID=279826 RepID=A0A4R2BB31_9BACI|nr:DUF3238 domain-containing protein [Mesobacillus foraminis]TCN22729.1 uncharacterized protein DUF3238 [Mesobacillus foraminis]